LEGGGLGLVNGVSNLAQCRDAGGGVRVQAELEDEDMRQYLLNTCERIRFEEVEGPVAVITQQWVLFRR